MLIATRTHSRPSRQDTPGKTAAAAPRIACGPTSAHHRSSRIRAALAGRLALMDATLRPAPLALGERGRVLVVDRIADAPFTTEGLLGGNAYRELGVGDATEGRVGMRHLRAIAPFDGATGRHWHDMEVHVVYVLKGRITYRFDGVEAPVVLGPHDCVSQPAGVPHDVIDRSEDLELLEITLPQRFGTYED